LSPALDERPESPPGTGVQADRSRLGGSGIVDSARLAVRVWCALLGCLSMDTMPWAALSGHYQVQPGCPVSIVGHRPVLGAGRLSRLLRGQRGDRVSRTLSNVFTLCAHAHRRSAELAVAAAQPETLQRPSPDPPALLWIETARDHLRSIALDWPQRMPTLAGNRQDLGWLHDCPLPLFMDGPCRDEAAAMLALGQLRAWLEARILGQSVVDWLEVHRDPDAMAAWCMTESDHLPPARCLADWYPLAQTLATETRGLDILDEDLGRQANQLRELAQSMVQDDGFVQRPTWRGQCAENGPWTRLRHRHGRPFVRHNAWTRLCARWMELMDIAAADPLTPFQGGVSLLSSGAMRLSEGQALAWCEMARGLLLHWVQLDAHGAVQDYRVLAPTEWNFHPEGGLARALAVLPPGATDKARILAAAFDPCVECTVLPPAAGECACA
jgi:hypothetical protein